MSKLNCRYSETNQLLRANPSSILEIALEKFHRLGVPVTAVRKHFSFG